MTAPPQSPLKHRLDFISPRLTPRILAARAGRAARVVQRLRFLLPAAAALVVLSLFIWPSLRPGFNLRDITKNAPDLVIDNLHYTGIDTKNQPYSILASQATRPSGLHSIYDLTKPEGEVTLQSGAWIDGKADYGRYDEAGKRLWLGGHVKVFHDKGYEMTTDEAQVNLENNDAWGEKPVLIQGDFGTIRGKGFRFLDSGTILIVTGPAHAILSLHSQAGSGNGRDR